MRKINTLDFKRATRTTSRDINRQILLNLVREHQPISRADLARRMEIGRGMVTTLTSELLAEGAIMEGAVGEAARGRKPTMLYVRTQDRLVIAVDVRFSRTYVMLGDFSGSQIAIENFETVTSPPELVAEIARRIDRLVETYAARWQVEGIGLVVPGMVDRATGRILNSPQLGWHDVDIREALEAAVGMPVKIENAPIACALAHMWMGEKGDAAGDFVYVTVSDGVGAGMVVNGQVVRGHGNTAGEFGHITLNPDGPRCLCGSRGCFEAYTSNLATLARYLGAKDLSPAESRELLRRHEMTFTDLVNRARTGDDRALEAIRETGRYLGLGLSMIVNALNPSRIVLGGEITAAWDLVAERVRREVADRALTRTAANTPIIPEQTSTHPRLRGATAIVAAPLFAAPQVA
ncbi:MAG TPA: ROK family protein [Longimicrobium sp.]|jgi:predicted NBD/HSP70 family sugar kinase